MWGKGGTSGEALGVSAANQAASPARWARRENAVGTTALLTFPVAGSLLTTACEAGVRSRSGTGYRPSVWTLHFFVRGLGDIPVAF